MSWLERDQSCPRCVDAAAFVLGALGDEEPEYQEHLAGCAVCQAEAAELREAIEAVSSSAPHAEISPALRERVMATVRAEAALLSAAGAGADDVPRRRGWLARQRSLLPAVALAAAAVAGVLVLGPSGHAARAIAARIASTSPGTHAVLRETDDRGELVITGMPQPPAGQTYELWIRKARGAPMATDALFSVSRLGSGSVDVPGSLSGVREVLVSAEPLGGSSHLTSAVLIRVNVS